MAGTLPTHPSRMMDHGAERDATMTGDDSSPDAGPRLEGSGDGAQRLKDRILTWWHHRYEGSAAQDLVQGLGEVEFGNWIILFGASFLLSVLPLILLLSAFAHSRVDDNIDTRLGLNQNNAHIVDALFKSSGAGWGFGVGLALIFSLAGTIAVARSIQRLYQQVFGQPDVKGWANALRCFVWAVAAALEIYVDALISRPLRDLPAGRVFLGLGNVVIATALFWWGLHWLLRGKESWRQLFPAGLATGVFWVGLGAFASVYFPSTLDSDSRLYGAIGVVFDLVTWFVAIGAVITLGALVGHIFVSRRGLTARRNGPRVKGPPSR
jgi:membrane protein